MTEPIPYLDDSLLMTLLPRVPPLAAACRKELVLRIEFEGGMLAPGRSSTLYSASLREDL